MFCGDCRIATVGCRLDAPLQVIESTVPIFLELCYNSLGNCAERWIFYSMVKKPKKKTKSYSLRWHASQESDELIFAVCDRYFSQLGRTSKEADSDDKIDPGTGEKHKGAASSVADWLQKVKGRTDLTREKIYPMFW